MTLHGAEFQKELISLMMEAVCTSETFVYFYEATRRTKRSPLTATCTPLLYGTVRWMLDVINA
jgi:hypothetical protein